VVLLAFLVGLALSLLGLTVAVVRAIRLWRQTKRTGRKVGGELSRFEERASRTERHLADWDRSNAGLQSALARLRTSRAQLQVLLDSLNQAGARVRWLRAFLPS
jgi:hypothetical protein